VGHENGLMLKDRRHTGRDGGRNEENQGEWALLEIPGSCD
jgi:hypothetical protein